MMVDYTDECECLLAVATDSYEISKVVNPTKTMWLIAVTNNPDTLTLMVPQTSAACWAAVRKCPWAIKHVINQTEAMCIEAVSDMGETIKHVRDITPAVIIAAMTHGRLHYTKLDASIRSVMEKALHSQYSRYNRSTKLENTNQKEA